MISKLLTTILLLLGVSLPLVTADGHLASEYTNNSILDNVTTSGLEPVQCPSTQTVFTATTEMVLEGRSELLSKDERHELMLAFMKIYNALTQSSCDSYFRRIGDLTFVNMSNTEGALVLLNKDNATTTNDTRRNLQTTDNFNDTSVPGVDIVYQVTGTCRDCPLTRDGSFQLYDDSFRRVLSERGMHMRVLQTNLLAYSNEAPQEDCQCVPGATPDEPQPPGVQECVDEMNYKFDQLRAAEGYFQDLEMADLLQLDEGVDDLEIDEEEGMDDLDNNVTAEAVSRSEDQQDDKMEQGESGSSQSGYGSEEATSRAVSWRNSWMLLMAVVEIAALTSSLS